MIIREEGKRKTRSDKKQAIAPYIPDQQRVWINRIARRCKRPAGEIGLSLIQAALVDENTMIFFSTYFKRDFRFTENITYCGHHDSVSIYDYINFNGERGRYKIKVSQSLYEQLCEFQIALGIPFLAHAVFALLQYALFDIKTIQKISPGITPKDFSSPTGPVIPIDDYSSVWSILK